MNYKFLLIITAFIAIFFFFKKEKINYNEPYEYIKFTEYSEGLRSTEDNQSVSAVHIVIKNNHFPIGENKCTERLYNLSDFTIEKIRMAMRIHNESIFEDGYTKDVLFKYIKIQCVQHLGEEKVIGKYRAISISGEYEKRD